MPKQTLPSGHSHEYRVEMARRITALALEDHGDKIAAVGIYGTTALSVDGPYSDLDMTVVTYGDLGERSTSYLYHGLLINLDYQSVAESEDEARDPAQAGNWLDFVALHDPAHIVDGLRRIAAGLTEADYVKAFHLKTCDDLPASVGKMRNAALEGDRASLLYGLSCFSVSACRALCLLNRRYVTGQARLRRETKALPVLPPDFARLIDIVAGAVVTEEPEMLQAAETLWEGMCQLAEGRGLSLEAPALRT